MRSRVRAGTGPQRLLVDWTACDGRGLCAELLPERVRRDPWGYPVVADGPVPPELAGEARAAVRACPVAALRLAGPAEH